MHDQGIAWLIAGGVRAESLDDQRQRMHRIAIANSNESKGGTILRLRELIGAVVGTRSVGRTEIATLSADCCPA